MDITAQVKFSRRTSVSWRVSCTSSLHIPNGRSCTCTLQKTDVLRLNFNWADITWIDESTPKKQNVVLTVPQGHKIKLWFYNKSSQPKLKLIVKNIVLFCGENLHH